MAEPIEDADWPYAVDGVERDAFAESLRVPIINTLCPRWAYITAVVAGSDPWGPLGVRPSDDELRMVASFHEEYIQRAYRESWAAKMRRLPFDLDSTAPGRYLVKHAHGGWAYAISTWMHGPRPRYDDEPMGLVAVMDRAHAHGGDTPPQHWTDWKAAHPDLFPTGAEGRRVEKRDVHEHYRDVHEHYREYIIPNPCYAGDLRSSMEEALADMPETMHGYDDAFQVIGRDDEIVLRVRVEDSDA